MTEPECTQKGGSESGTCAGGYVTANSLCDYNCIHYKMVSKILDIIKVVKNFL